MNSFQQPPVDNSGLIQKAAFDYLNNTFSTNPAQPLQGGPNGRGGSVSQPNPPQNNLDKAVGLAKLMGGGAGAAGGF